MQTMRLLRVFCLLMLFFLLMSNAPASASEALGVPGGRFDLSQVTIVIDSSEPSYIQYGARDLASYLSQITGQPVPVLNTSGTGKKTNLLILVGQKASQQAGVQAGGVNSEPTGTAIIRSVEKNGVSYLMVSGSDSHGTNSAIATLIKMVKVAGNSPYLESPVDLKEKPAFALRGIHLNGWPLNYPYAFRAWHEEDWKRFVDIAWAQRINLFYLWPFMEILPVPLSAEDEAYLQEVRRVVDYAQNQRGMEVWIMQSANRIGTSDCGVRDPRFRTYWVNECQKDMNPADPQQFARIEKSFEAFYKIVNNADAFCMIDSDPGGWPQSPVSDQIKIFKAARNLLDKYSVHGRQTKLVDWMHVGWGRHKFFTSTDSVVAAYDWTSKNPDESDVAFMDETIRSFKKDFIEPWNLIAGQPPYLSVVQKESVLEKTVYLPYGAIESEPAFPATNLGQASVRKVFDKAADYPGLNGVMGNNQLMLLQFPRTFYFYETAWNTTYQKRPEKSVMLDLATELYPDHRELIADSYLSLTETDSEKINTVLGNLQELVKSGGGGRPGALGRFLFPDSLVVAKNLNMQLQIRAARQSLLKALKGKTDLSECARLIEDYFDKLLAWNKETGWDKMIEITVWPQPIYEGGKDLEQALYRLKQILAQGAPYTSYSKTNAFFEGIARNLLKKYGEDSVMVGCIEPFKLAVIQSQ